jgi:type I restriction enzyme S subunit
VAVKAGYRQTEVGVIPEEWEVVKFSQVCKKTLNGGTPSTKIPEYWKGTIPWITGADVVDQRIKEVRKSITVEAIKNSATHVVTKGNLLLVTRTGVGKVAIAPFDIAISQDLTGIIPTEDASVAYLFWIFNRANRHFLNMNQGTSINGITRNDLMDFALPLPPIPEQTAIAAALSDADALITALDRLIAKKRAIKQGAMQELLTGKTRLPGFEGEWEVYKFGDIFQFLKTGSNSRSDLLDNGNVKYIHYGDIHAKSTSFLDCKNENLPFIDENKVQNLPNLEDGDLIMVDASEDYEGIGKSVEIINAKDQKVVAGLHTLLLRGNRTILANGFKGYLQNIFEIKTALIRLATGISVYGISKYNIQTVEIKLPPLPEQTAIASILSDMDAEIAALERKRDKALMIKEGMMQELLTGRTRLV